jgi:hypothetical protein
MQYIFEWDPCKARDNADKHGVTFELATTVFKDSMAVTVYDEDNSSRDEDRWITLGQVNRQHYLVVAHTYHNPNDKAVTIRLISARSATKREIQQYERG